MLRKQKRKWRKSATKSKQEGWLTLNPWSTITEKWVRVGWWKGENFEGSCWQCVFYCMVFFNLSIHRSFWSFLINIATSTQQHLVEIRSRCPSGCTHSLSKVDSMEFTPLSGHLCSETPCTSVCSGYTCKALKTKPGISKVSPINMFAVIIIIIILSESPNDLLCLWMELIWMMRSRNRKQTKTLVHEWNF